VPIEDGLALLERNEDALRLPPATGLLSLAEGTGGFLIGGTNDLGPGLGRVAEELQEHYVLAYSPKNQDYDGRFRSIEVKVRRSHSRLQARKGYLAVRTATAVPLLEHEAKALARLEASPLPTEVPLRLRGLHFPGDAALARVPVYVELESAGLSATKDKKAGVYRQDFTVLVLVRDRERRVAAKLSQRYALEGRLSESDAGRPRVLFSRETSLPPGSYTVEAIVYDTKTGVAGAAIAPLEVPTESASHLRASSLVVVDRAETRAPGKGPDGSPPAALPLQYGDLVLYPNLGQPLRRGTEKALAFSVTAVPAAERRSVDAQVEILREGRRVAAPPPTSLEADADGRFRLVSSLPLDAFPPGNYELRVTLSDGRDAETRSATVPILP